LQNSQKKTELPKMFKLPEKFKLLDKKGFELMEMRKKERKKHSFPPAPG